MFPKLTKKEKEKIYKEIAEHNIKEQKLSSMYRILEEIKLERCRQREKEGWTENHDDKFINGELSDFAAYYAHSDQVQGTGNGDGSDDISLAPILKSIYPISWTTHWAKKSSKSRKQQLIVAAALIVAELERLERMGDK